MVARRKADAITKERRVEAIYRLILDGWTTPQIMQNTADWGLKERQRRAYVAEARRRIEEVGRLGLEELRAEHIAFRRQLRREAKTVKDKLAAAKDEAELLGLYPHKTVVVQSWQDEVVELLRTGGIDPDDVRAAYPDLAPQFFAKAGVSVGDD